MEEAEPIQAGVEQPGRAEPAVAHAGSSVDAMGHDKRRQVVGRSYGPSKARQLAYYGIFIAGLIVVYILGSIAISQLDTAPKTINNNAPWSKGTAPQIPPHRFQ